MDSTPDAKVSSFFAKKKGKKKAPAPTPAAPKETPASPPMEPKKPVIQTKGKVLSALSTTPAAAEEATADDDEVEAANDPNKTHWMMKPKKKNEGFSTEKRIPIHSERAFPTLANASGNAVPVAGGKPVKAPADVRSQTMWSKLADSDDED